MKRIPRSWLSPTIRIAAAGLGAAVSGDIGAVLGATFGGWLLDSLSIRAAEPIKRHLEKLFEKASEKLLDTSADALIEKLGHSEKDLQSAYREALRRSLATLRQQVGSDFTSWFENWEACLAGEGKLELPAVDPKQLAAENLDVPLCRALQALDAQGRFIRGVYGALTDGNRTIPQPLLTAVTESLPELLSHHLKELLVETRYEAGWRQMQMTVMMHLTTSFEELATVTEKIALKTEMLDDIAASTAKIVRSTATLEEIAACVKGIAHKIEIPDGRAAESERASPDAGTPGEIAAVTGRAAPDTEALGGLAAELAACRRILEDLKVAQTHVPSGAAHLEASPDWSFRTCSSEDRAAILSGYLKWLVRSLRNLPNGIEIGNQRIELPLEEVYVSVRGFPGAITEIQQSQKLDEETPGEASEEPTVWQQRDRKLQFASLSLKTFDLAEAFRESPTLIILGDPGCGKTTLTRWLALNFANAMLLGHPELLVPATSVDSAAAPTESHVSLGRVRLPVYLRLADFAVYCKSHPGASLMQSLAEGIELGRPLYPTGHPRAGEPIETERISSMMLEFLNAHEAAVFLDGLDEFTQPKDREVAVKRIHDFIDIFMPRRAPSALPEGNRLLVTSRRVGYKAHALRDQVRPFTVEELSVQAIQRFSDAWHRACHKALSATSQPEFDASAAAAGFFEQVSRRQSLRDLSRNPLMLNLLCLVNFENRHQLPESRAELYEILVNRGFNRTFIDRERSGPELAPLLSDILIGVATHIHETNSNGLVDGAALAGVIRNLLRQQGPRGTLLGTAEQVFLLITSSAGLMAERGAGKFGFRHLTIQEYLAGRGLVAEPDRAAALVLEKAPDPRWREAILLGLGYLSEQASASTFEAVCSRLLDRSAAPDTEPMPLGAMIIAEALGEVRRISSEIVGTALRQLLDAYAISLAQSEQREYRELVETTFALLIRNNNLPDQWFAEAEHILIASLSGRSLAHARAAARIANRGRLFLSSLAEPLLRALRSDCEEFGWIFTHTLQAMASCKALSFSRHPASVQVLSQLESKTVATVSDPRIVHSARILLSATGTPDRSVGIGIPAYLLPMRQALESDSELTAIIRRGDLQWMRLMVGLYGGLGNFGAVAIRREIAVGRSQVASTLTDSATALETALYLDATLLPRWEAIKKLNIEFEPAFIYRESPLTPLLLATLRERTPVAALREKLENIWQDPRCDIASDLIMAYEHSVALNASDRDDERRAEIHLLTDSIVALALLDDDFDLGARVGKTQQQKAAIAAARHQLGSIRTSLEETLALCETEARDFLKALIPQLEPPPPAPSTGLALTMSESVAETFPDAPNGTGTEFIESIAQIFVQLLSNTAPDAGHQAAVLIDTQGRLLTQDLGALIAAWILIATRYRDAWLCSVERSSAYCCINVGSRAISIVHGLAALSAIPGRLHFLKGWLLRQFARALYADGPARVLALSITWSLRHQRASFLDALSGLAPEWVTASPQVYRSRVLELIAAFAPSDAFIAFWALRCLEPISGSIESPWVSELESLGEKIADEQERLVAVSEVDLLKRTGDASSSVRETGRAAPDAGEIIAAVSRVIEGSGAAPVDTLDLIKPDTAALSDALTQYWRKIFLGDDEDVVYSLCVVLDTKGKDLSHDRAALAASLACSIPIARALRWDHRVTVLPSRVTNSALEHALHALLFLSLVPERFEFFTSWSLGRLAPLLRQVFPDLLPLAAAIAVELDDEHRQHALSRISPDLAGMPYMEAIRLIQESLQTIIDPYVSFHTLRHLRKLSGTPAPITVAVDWVKGIADAVLRQQAMEMLFLEEPIELLETVGAAGAVALIGTLHHLARRIAVCQLLLSGLPPDAAVSLLSALKETGWLAGTDPHEQLLLDGLSSQRMSPTQSGFGVGRWIESRAGDPAAVKRAPLCAITLCLRLDFLLSVWEGNDADPLMWQALVREPDNDSAYSQLLNRARAGKARLDADSIAAIQTLWTDCGRGRRRLMAILPLIRISEAAGIAALHSWSSSRDDDRFLARWAALMLAERGFSSPAIFKHCVALLRGSSDLLKHRATLAIDRNEIGSRHPVRASVLGVETLEQMARDALTNEKVQPSTTLKIGWSFEAIVYDSVSYLERWISLVATNGKDAPAAEYLLGATRYARPAVTVRLLEVLESDAPARAKSAVLRSFIHFSHTGWGKLPFSQGIASRLLIALRGLMRSAEKRLVRTAACVFGYVALSTEDCLVLFDIAGHPEWEIQCAALHSLALLIERSAEQKQLIMDRLDQFLASPRKEVSEAAAHVLVRGGESIARLSAKIANEDTLLSALISGVDGYYENESYRLGVTRAAQFIQAATVDYLERNPEGFGHLLTKALDRLNVALPPLEEGDGRNLEPSQRLGNILPICAAAAELMPDTYLRVLRTQRWADLARCLAEAACRQETFTGRRAALTLLSLGRRFTPHAAKAIESALADVLPVQATAVETTARFLEIDAKSWDALERLLASPSECTVWTATRIILEIVNNESLSPEDRERSRQRAQKLLAQRLRSSDLKRLVCVLDGDHNAAQIHVVDWLDTILRNALYSLGAGRMAQVKDVTGPRDSPIEMRVRATRPPERREFRFLVPAAAAREPIKNQLLWVEKKLNGSIHHELSAALANASEVATRNQVSCAELLQLAVRHPTSNATGAP